MSDMSELTVHSYKTDLTIESEVRSRTNRQQRNTVRRTPTDTESVASAYEPVTNGTAEDLDNAMDDVIRDYHPRLSRYSVSKISGEIGRYTPLVRKHGLSREHFHTFMNILLNHDLPLKLNRTLLGIAIPRESVPEAFIVKIIGLLANVKSDKVYVNHLLIWTISVFEYIDSLVEVKKLYAVMFHYIGQRITRNNLCHLLYYLTRKEDVVPNRIRKLNALMKREKEIAPLIGLLLVYRTFDPKVEVPVAVRLGEIFIFEHPNPELKDDLTNIRRRNEDNEQYNTRKPFIALPSAKKLKKYQQQRLQDEIAENPQDIDVLQVFDQLESLQYSERLQEVLDDQDIQQFLVCNPDEIAIARLSYWIGHKILYLIRWNNSEDRNRTELRELMNKLLKLTRFAKSQLPVVEKFMKEYLSVWNGVDSQDVVFELITYIKPSDYSVLYQTILLPLYKRFYVHDVTWKAKLVLCYMEWLKNWALLDWRGHKELATTTDDVDTINCMFDGLSFDVDYFETIQKLVDHVDRLCIKGLLMEADHPLMQHAALSFFELVSAMPLKHDVPEIIMPASNFIHRCFFSSNAIAVSRICGIIYQYKLAYMENESKTDDWISRHSPEYLRSFNTYTTDLCNSLWRNMGFIKVAGGSNGFGLSDEVVEALQNICAEREQELRTTLSITQSVALSGFSKRFMMELETQESSLVKHSKPITPAYLRKLEEDGGITLAYSQYRIDYLDYLKEKGLTGIYDLLYACMTTLINRRLENRRQSVE